MKTYFAPMLFAALFLAVNANSIEPSIGSTPSQAMVIHLISGGKAVKCYNIVNAQVIEGQDGVRITFRAKDVGLVRTNLEFIIEQFGNCDGAAPPIAEIPLEPIVKLEELSAAGKQETLPPVNIKPGERLNSLFEFVLPNNSRFVSQKEEVYIFKTTHEFEAVLDYYKLIYKQANQVDPLKEVYLLERKSKGGREIVVFAPCSKEFRKAELREVKGGVEIKVFRNNTICIE